LRHVVCIGERRNVYVVVMENIRERRPVGRIKLEYRIILPVPVTARSKA
jgi:hypothetical protein